MTASIWNPDGTQEVPSLPAVSPVTFVKGDVATPGINFVGDTNTGIWSESDGYINFSINGVNMLTIDSLGNVIANKFVGGTEIDIASAATCDIGAQVANFIRITGTNNIISFGTNFRGPVFIRFQSALVLTHNSSTLILPGAANISISSGDTLIAVPKAITGTSDGWYVLGYSSPAPLLNAVAAIIGVPAGMPISNVSSMNGGQLAGLRSKVTNGNFSVNQRVYVSGAAVGAGLYGHDCWKMAASGDTYTFSVTANKVTITIPAGKVLRQVIEGLDLESGTYCMSWEGTAQGKIGAGSLSASGVTGVIVGGTDTTIEFGPGTVSLVMFELGTVATPFEHLPYRMELANCQRYCFVSTAEFIGNSTTTSTLYNQITFPQTMRAIPVLNAGASFTVNTGSAGTPVFDQGSLRSGRLTNSAANWTVGALIKITGVFSADL